MSSVKKQKNRQVIKIFKLRSSLGLLKSLHVRSSSCSSDNFSATFNLPDFIHWNKKLYSIKKIKKSEISINMRICWHIFIDFSLFFLYSIKKIKKSEISINMCQQILIFFLLTHIICQFRFTSTYSNNFESSFSNLQATLNFLQYSCHRSGHYFLITKQSFDESLL